MGLVGLLSASGGGWPSVKLALEIMQKIRLNNSNTRHSYLERVNIHFCNSYGNWVFYGEATPANNSFLTDFFTSRDPMKVSNSFLGGDFSGLKGRNKETRHTKTTPLPKCHHEGIKTLLTDAKTF